MADGGNYIPFSGHPQTAFQWAHPRPAVQSHSVLTILDQHTSVVHGQGLHIVCGGHDGSGPPSACTWVEFESAPASNRPPTRNSKNLFTVELLFRVNWEVQPW